MENGIVPVILAGGTGSRLWPLSRSSYPKQVLNLINNHTLLQQTLLRLQSFNFSDTPIIITNHEHRFIVAEQVRQLNVKAEILVETMPRNTAPAITLATLQACTQQENPLILVIPADHYIAEKDYPIFYQKLFSASAAASQGYLVTFGIVPTAPETGYGYIRIGKAIGDQAFYIKQFVEKPSLASAQKYLKTSEYLWNSGNFLFNAKTFLQEVQQYTPDILNACQRVFIERQKDLNFTVVKTQDIPSNLNISIDYAIMECSQKGAVVPTDITWCDIGSWSSLFKIEEKNLEGNVIHGDVITEQTQNCYIRSTGRLIATLGLQDHIVIETDDSVLVAHKNKSQEIKKIVATLEQGQRTELTNHSKVYRPWGYFQTLIKSNNFKVKKIAVEPGASLSLQRHQHRSEHWIVVQGVATVINGDTQSILYPSQSTYIPKGTKHRLSNFSDEILELIEIQTGTYLEEDDIERLQDNYGRLELA